MSGLITRCPKCATAFNVTEAHLNTANGAVRCGSCLNVFNGRENLTNTLKRSPASTLLDDDDDLLISDDLELDDHIDDEPEKDPVRERVQSILDKTSTDDNDSDDDESWALALLEEEGHNPSQLGLKEKKQKDATKSKRNIKGKNKASGSAKPASDKAVSQSPATQAVDEQAPVERSRALDEANSPVEAEPEDRETSVADDLAQRAKTEDLAKRPEPAPEPEPEPEPEPKPTQAAQKAQEYAAAKAQEPEPEPEINEADLNDLRQELAASPPEPEAPRTLFDAIEVEAVELHVTSNKTRWISRIVWGLLVVIAGTALAAQVAWLKFDEWSVQDPYRKYYAMACEHIGCTLPVRKDIRQIRTSNLLVREHPNKQDALLVDVVIQNHANYEQPFPKLTLVFSNIKNKVIASRAFSPQEYLGGDLAGATMMPSLKAIHLSLDLEDPGKGAVSYKVKIEE